MTGVKKRNIQWVVMFTAAVALCAVLCILLMIQSNKYKSAQSALEQKNEALSAQLDAQNNRTQEEAADLENLTRENEDLKSKLSDYKVQFQHDVFSFDQYLPLDLVQTVLAYYQSLADKDSEAFKELIPPEEGEVRSYMLDSFNRVARPNQEGGVRCIILLDATPHDFNSVKSSAFEGGVALKIYSAIDQCEILYLSRENGKWYVTAYD